MVWRWVSISLFIIGILSLPFWPYSKEFTIYPTAFCWFLTVLTLLVSIFGKRGSELWRHKGQG
ncbi:MAG: hypothetical protein WB992_13575 [Bryobacteraceae bacterium]